MSNGTIPRGPALEFDRDRAEPCIFPFSGTGISTTDTMLSSIAAWFPRCERAQS